MISSNISQDLTVASKLEIRSIFFSENATHEDYEFMENFKPEFQVMSHLHFPSVLKQIENDIEYLDSKLHDESDNSYLSYIKELPSQNLITVGVALKTGKGREEDHYLKNGIFMNSDKIRYICVSLDTPLEYQGPFDVIVCKLIKLFKNFDEKSMNLVYNLEKFWDNNGVTLVNKFEYVRNMLTRLEWNNIANVFLKSEECKEIWERYNKLARTSKIAFIERKDVCNEEIIKKLMKEAEIEFPIVAKLNEVYNIKSSHSKYFIHDEEGLNNLCKDKLFVKESVTIEELVPHSEDLLIKMYYFSDKIWYWKIMNSIPQSYSTSNVISHKADEENKATKIPGWMSFSNPDDIKNENRFDIIFLNKICEKLMRTIKVNFLGFDFIISSIDGS